MNWFDIAIIGVVGLSALLAMFRGFIKEMLSLIGWVGAAIVTFLVLPYARPYARQIVKNETVADIGAGVVVFLIVLIVWAFLSGFVTRRLRGGAFGFVDGFFGLVYGVARGALLVAIGYLLLQFAYKDNMPAWATAAVTKPYLERGVAILKELSPEEWFEKGRKAIEDVQRGGEPRPGPGVPGQPNQSGQPPQPPQPERQ